MNGKTNMKQTDVIEIPSIYQPAISVETGSGGGGVGVADQHVDRDKQYMKTYSLTEQQIAQIREAFNEYDLMGLETIPAHDFGDALRLAGQVPSESEVQEMLKQAVLDDTGCLTFDEFVKAVGQRGWVDEAEVVQELEDALRYFDKEGNGWLDAQEMRSILKTHGEPLDDDDVTEMVKLVDIKNNGRMDCNEIMKKLTSK